MSATLDGFISAGNDSHKWRRSGRRLRRTSNSGSPSLGHRTGGLASNTISADNLDASALGSAKQFEQQAGEGSLLCEACDRVTPRSLTNHLAEADTGNDAKGMQGPGIAGAAGHSEV